MRVICRLTYRPCRRLLRQKTVQTLLLHRTATFSHWSHVEQGPSDPVLGVQEAYVACQNPSKVNLGVGAYRGSDGKPWVLPSVAKAEKRVIEKADHNHEYAAITGLPRYCDLAKRLVFGDLSDLELSRIVSVQTVSGSGALRSLGNLISQHRNYNNSIDEFCSISAYENATDQVLNADIQRPTIHIPKETWAAHGLLFSGAGLNRCRYYEYFDYVKQGLQFEGLLRYIDRLDGNKDVLMFHATAHNPTGVDPTPDQWKTLCDACVDRKLLVLFDLAYQGFASGDFDRDAFAIRLFKDRGVPIMVAQSFAKNFGLYGQRAGAAHVICDDTDQARRLESQFKPILRQTWSNPPLHGARIVEEILECPELKQEWLSDVKTMSKRISDMRELLKLNLEKETGQDWSRVCTQIGMFCYTGLSQAQVRELTEKYSVFLMSSGRISMAGVTPDNVKYIAQSIAEVIRTVK